LVDYRRCKHSGTWGEFLRYHADITAGSLKVRESRIIADLLMSGIDREAWDVALVQDNVLQTSSPATAKRLGQLLRLRLQTMDDKLWALIRDGSLIVATHACLAAAIKHRQLLGDFLDLVMRDNYKLRIQNLAPAVWQRYIEDCQSRDPDMPIWSESTVRRLRSSVFQILAQAGYVESTQSLKLQAAHISRDVMKYLHDHDEAYVLRCIQVGS
jgi:hypothetical protein